MTPYELIQRYKDAKGLTSDNAAAKELGITRAAISHIKNGGGFGLDTSWQVAETLGMKPAEVIAICELARAERSDKSEEIQTWRKRLQAVSHSAASLFFGSALLATAVEGVRHCILCSIDYAGRKGAKLGF